MRVSYLIPCFNAHDDLTRSLQSLRENVDVLIVDDGSHPSVESQLCVDDYPFTITILTLEQNMGIERALNLGLKFLYERYDIVARLDCGDLSREDRISKQITYFERDSELVLLGGWARFVDDNYTPLFISEVPVTHPEIVRGMYLNNMFIHPAVMMRLSAVKALGGYPLNRAAAEDYALFFKLAEVGRIFNVPEPLIDYVVSSNSISAKKRRVQIRSRILVMLDNWQPSFRCQYGIIRSVLLFLIPRVVTTFIRAHFKVY